MWRFAILPCCALIALCSGCKSTLDEYVCATSADCVGSQVGRCEPSGHCSFADSECAAGFRFGKNAGTESGQCATNVNLDPDAGDSALCVRGYPSLVFSGDTATVDTCSGQAPFTYVVRSGLGSIDDSGALLTSNTTGTIIVDVTDALGATGSATITNIDPATFESASLWVRSDELISMPLNEEISEWPAVAGASLTQPSVGKMPKYRPSVIGTFPGIHFDGVDDRLAWPSKVVPVLGDGARTVVAVIANGEPRGQYGNVVVGWGGSGYFLQSYGLAFNLDSRVARGGSNIGVDYHGLSNASACLSSSSNPSSEPTIILTSYDGTTERVWVNGHLVGEHDITLATTDVNALGVGGITGYVNVYKGYQGDVMEAIVFDHGLEEDNRTLLQCGLGQKYGIAMKDCSSGSVEILPSTTQRMKIAGELPLEAQGGRPPYEFSVAQGDGTVDAESGLFRAANLPGTSLLQVEDSSGAVSEVTIEVSATPRAALWLAADRITGVVDGAELGEWADISGNRHHLRQARSAEKPTFITNGGQGFPVVRFDGVNDTLSNGIAPVLRDRPRTLVAVVANAVPDEAVRAIVSYGGLLACRRFFGINILKDSNNLGGAYGCVEHDSQDPISSGIHVLMLVHSPEGEEFYNNGVRSSSPVISLDTVDHTGVIVGSSVNKVDVGYFAGDLAEVIFFEGALSEADRTALIDTLMDKYDVP